MILLSKNDISLGERFVNFYFSQILLLVGSRADTVCAEERIVKVRITRVVKSGFYKRSIM